MKHIISANIRAIEALQHADDVSGGYPKRGAHVGGGRHIKISDEQTGLGWTQHGQAIRKHPERDEWAYPSDAPGAVELPADWTPGPPSHAVASGLND